MDVIQQLLVFDQGHGFCTCQLDTYKAVKLAKENFKFKLHTKSNSPEFFQGIGVGHVHIKIIKVFKSKKPLRAAEYQLKKV